MNFLFLLIALALVVSFLYSLLHSWWLGLRTVLFPPFGVTRKDRWGILFTLIIVTALPAWFAWQVWMAWS